YDTIAASGNNACTLHWIRNDGQVRDGDLVLVDAGAEADSLYTADITRTLPVSGAFTEVQAKIYDAVLAASDAAFAVAADHANRPVSSARSTRRPWRSSPNGSSSSASCPSPQPNRSLPRASSTA